MIKTLTVNKTSFLAQVQVKLEASQNIHREHQYAAITLHIEPGVNP
jgi:hypothetical protein